MESRLKQRISRMLQAPFQSCRSSASSSSSSKSKKDPLDMAQSPRFYPSRRLFKNETRPLFNTKGRTRTRTRTAMASNPVFFRASPFAESEGRLCPPVTPISPPTSYHETKTQNHRKKEFQRNDDFYINNYRWCTSSSDTGWFSSEEGEERERREREEEVERLFWSKSYSSDSSDLQLMSGKQRRRRRRGERKQRRKKRENGSKPMVGEEVRVEKKVRESVAVVKRSKDPYSDFRASMLEMIVHKQIFGAEELKHLLHCFLSLNSSHHHHVILQAFSEICQALFSNTSLCTPESPLLSFSL
ncbi:transcription repressor OFP8-like [Amborella trichopoda]|uniref:Transcription repressor n=1 Tax=Amborella trichopoda TaxID=13333 RepID=W1NSB5_AMBTC|nr:transcription repressor OFP8-like [Amborella trichopoda]ERM98558.1 hypothetical protein AMTR_s00109p00024120 [Amborella trichopoda]|eukprot:XP_020518293.1 transcription repressor OFP8-like [Amborella trichopoda]